jgi:DNA-binding MarR family transcriptional regulator/N-acetylglutamate synthase-like GNAT family acetyltransferase
MDFYDRQGPVALGSRLRRLGDWMAEEAARVYQAYETPLQPRWYPVFQVLAEKGRAAVTEIAGEVGHTHASVSQIIAQMRRRGFVTLRRSSQDGRSTVVSLSPRGRAAVPRIREQCRDVSGAVSALLQESGGTLWTALAAFEGALRSRSLVERTLEIRRSREAAADVRIVPFAARYRTAFKRLNEAWIREHFTLEQTDREMLDEPENRILRPGGHVLVALRQMKPVGVCALVPHGERCFELAKMTVAKTARGHGIGLRLGEAAVEKARASGATRLYLETNAALKPAIALYRKLGFTEVTGGCSPYARCNVQMERTL